MSYLRGLGAFEVHAVILNLSFLSFKTLSVDFLVAGIVMDFRFFKSKPRSFDDKIVILGNLCH